MTNVPCSTNLHELSYSSTIDFLQWNTLMKEVLRAFCWPLKGLHLSVLITKPLLAIKSISLQFLPLCSPTKTLWGVLVLSTWWNTKHITKGTATNTALLRKEMVAVWLWAVSIIVVTAARCRDSNKLYVMSSEGWNGRRTSICLPQQR